MIYEHLEKEGIMEWNYVGNFGGPNQLLFFPPVIKSIENEKFIFYPRETTTENFYYEITCSENLELWEKNENLTRSTLEFPINIPPTISNVWILQL